MQNLNPTWKQYNDLNNEGGEGYNPHRRHLGEEPVPEELDCMSAPMGSWSGRPISRAEAERLLGEEMRLLHDAELRAKCGDFSAAAAVGGIKARVAHYESQLA